MRTGQGWQHVAPPTLSSDAPRHLVEFQKRLYVRHGTGLVDAYDGGRWQKDALRERPRRTVFALAADAKTLVCADWGGWSEWDGAHWTAHYNLPALKNVPVLNVALAGDDLWLATQARGVGRYNRKTGNLRFYDERDGLTDDWITALLVTSKNVWAGTFVGGLARFDGQKWTVVPELQGENVTSIAQSENGVYAATRHGLWRVSDEGAAHRVGPIWLDSEQQALLTTPEGLWVGARTSLNFWRPPAASEVSSAAKNADTVKSKPDAHAVATPR